MTSVALLNEPSDSEVSKKMVQMVKAHLHDNEQKLLRQTMERDVYLSTFARASVLRDLADELEREYRKAFET